MIPPLLPSLLRPASPQQPHPTPAPSPLGVALSLGASLLAGRLPGMGMPGMIPLAPQVNYLATQVQQVAVTAAAVAPMAVRHGGAMINQHVQPVANQARNVAQHAAPTVNRVAMTAGAVAPMAVRHGGAMINQHVQPVANQARNVAQHAAPTVNRVAMTAGAVAPMAVRYGGTLIGQHVQPVADQVAATAMGIAPTVNRVVSPAAAIAPMAVRYGGTLIGQHVQPVADQVAATAMGIAPTVNRVVGPAVVVAPMVVRHGGALIGQHVQPIADQVAATATGIATPISRAADFVTSPAGIRAGTSFVGQRVGTALDLPTSPARAIFPDIIPSAREEFAARPEGMVKGALISASFISAAMVPGTLFFGGGRAAAAGLSASGVSGASGAGGAAMGFATRTAPAAIEEGLKAAMGIGGATLPLAIANEIFPTWPDPGPRFPTGHPPEIGGGRNPFDLGPDHTPGSTWEPGQGEIGPGERVSRLVLQGPTTPIGSDEIRIRHDLAEILPRADAWRPGAGEILHHQPPTPARFRLGEAIPGPSPTYPFGPSFPDAFPDIFPTGPRFITDEGDSLLSPSLPEVPTYIDETARYIFTPQPRTQVNQGVASWTRVLEDAAARDAAGDLTADRVTDFFLSRPVDAVGVRAAAMAVPASQATSVNLPEVVNPATATFQVPTENPVEFPREYFFDPAALTQERRRRDRDASKRKKKGKRADGLETAFWENLRVATPQEFLGMSAPRRRRVKRGKK